MRFALRMLIAVSGGVLFTLHLMVFLSICIGGYQPSEKFVAMWTSVACLFVGAHMLSNDAK